MWNLFAFCFVIGAFSVVFRHQYPEYELVMRTEDVIIKLFNLNKSNEEYMVAMLESTKQEMQSRVSAQSGRIGKEDPIEFATIIPITDTIIGQFDTIEDAKQAVSNSKVDNNILKYVTDTMTNAQYYSIWSDSAEFVASAGGQYDDGVSGNGGGCKFKYFLTVQRTENDQYQMIFVIASRQYEIADKTEWIEVEEPKVIKKKKEGSLVVLIMRMKL